MDIVGVLRGETDYTKNRNYWKYLKAKFKRENSQLVSYTTRFRLLAPDKKRRMTDCLDYDGIIELAKSFPQIAPQVTLCRKAMALQRMLK